MHWSQSQGKQVVADLVVYLKGQRHVLKYSQENNRSRQADESPGPSLGRKCGKGGNKEACGYFQETKQNKTKLLFRICSQNTLLRKGKQFLRII